MRTRGCEPVSCLRGTPLSSKGHVIKLNGHQMFGCVGFIHSRDPWKLWCSFNLERIPSQTQKDCIPPLKKRLYLYWGPTYVKRDFTHIVTLATEWCRATPSRASRRGCAHRRRAECRFPRNQPYPICIDLFVNYVWIHLLCFGNHTWPACLHIETKYMFVQIAALT